MMRLMSVSPVAQAPMFGTQKKQPKPADKNVAQLSLLPELNTVSSRTSSSPAQNVTQLVNTNRLVKTFINLAKIGSTSKDDATSHPSTPGQTVVAGYITSILHDYGLEDIHTDQNSVVTATLPSNLNTGKNEPIIGLFAHMDTSNAAPGDNVKPQIHKNYQGGNIVLKGDTTIKAKHLQGRKGQDIITSDGTTLLGADDKAGIAEILETLKVLKENPDIKHPRIRVAFTPDEETGDYIKHFDIQKFGADFAYTADSDSPASLETETFNAHKVDVSIEGVPVHPGFGKKGGLVNPIIIGTQLVSRLPKNARPETTEGMQGFYYVYDQTGNPEQATYSILIRDFNYQNSLKRIERLKAICADLQQKNPTSKIKVTVTETYRNMGDILKKFPHVAGYAKEAMKRCGLVVEDRPIRGGTDGSTLTLNGLPTPNLCGGGQLFHSKKEFVSIQDMKTCVGVLLNTLSVWAEHIKKGDIPTLPKRKK